MAPNTVPEDIGMRPSLSRFATTILAALLVVACGSATSPDPSTTPPLAAPPRSSPSAVTPLATPGASTAWPSLPPAPPSASLPVRGSAREIGVLTAAGPDGTVYVAISKPDGSVLALLESSGRPRPGWPILVKDSTSCGRPMPVEDGSVRIICTLENRAQDVFGPTRAFAVESNGRMLAGWPVDLGDHGAEGFAAARVIGDALTIYAWATIDSREFQNSWIMTVDADGAVRNGTQTRFVNCCDPRWAVGPDGVAYGSINDYGGSPEAPKSSELFAVGLVGVRAGFPIAIEGLSSEPSFDAVGRIHITANDGPDRTARTLVFDTDGQAVGGGSDELGITATDDCMGIEGSCEVPAAPLVGPDGTRFVIDFSGTTVVGLSPSGQVMAGWPYRPQRGPSVSICCPEDSDPVVNFAPPAIGRDNVLFLLHAAAAKSVGGSIVAVGPDGRVRPGWPVELTRPGAEFWSVVVGSDGTAYALAIEPEANDTSSATILAIAPDSTVLYTATVVEP